MHKHPTTLTPADGVLGDVGVRVARIAGTLGVIGLVASGVSASGSPEAMNRFFHSYLVAFGYFLSLTLGAMFFVILQHLTRSGWSVVVRRLAEGIAGNMLLLAVLGVPVVVGMHHLYHWADAEAVSRDAILQAKQAYLNPPFFVVRLAVCFVVWIGLAGFFRRHSIRQDSDGDIGRTLRMEKWSGPAMILLGVTLTFAAFDLLMSLDPHWYSTIFGVYYFSGGLAAFFALLSLVVFAVQRAGRLTAAITGEHYHDLGKLVFAFVVFWAYIAFSQYLLIWYANIPEETVWYLRRQSADWSVVGLLLLAGHFVVPFLVLMARGPKRRPAVLAVWSIWVLLLHWVDMYWLVLPQASPETARPLLADVTCFVGVGGLFVAATAMRLRRQSLVPLRDPRLRESLMFENV